MASLQEVTLDYSANTAEVPTGGVRINIIPREGGNTFNGTFFSSIATGAMQANNLTDELRSQGLRTPDAVRKLWDVNPGFGGPMQPRQDLVLRLGALLRLAAGRRRHVRQQEREQPERLDLRARPEPAGLQGHALPGRRRAGDLAGDTHGTSWGSSLPNRPAAPAWASSRRPWLRRPTSAKSSRSSVARCSTGRRRSRAESCSRPGEPTTTVAACACRRSQSGPQMITVNEQSTGLRYRAADNFRNGPNHAIHLRFAACVHHRRPRDQDRHHAQSWL